MTSVWQRRSGLVTSADGEAVRARDVLEAASVLAVVESEPEYPDAVTVAVAVDEAERVAVVDESRTAIVAGPSLRELADELARACGGQVSFGDVVVGDEIETPADPSDPFDPDIGVVTAYVPDRSVVFTRADVAGVSALAAVIGRPVVAAPYADGQLVLVSDGPALSALDWPDSVQPALVIEQGAAYPVVAVVAGESVHLHTWDADAAVLPADAALDSLVRPFADSVLASGALVARIRTVVPEADGDALRAAIDAGGGAGPEALLRALTLPDALAGFLEHGEDVPPLEGARVLQPDRIGQVFARAVTDASAQMSGSVREHTEQMRERAERQAEQMRERAEAARVRAESAFDAAETFTEEVVVPIRQSWWTPVAAAVEASVGGLALYRASRGVRTGSSTSAGERVLGIVGALLLVDAVVNTVVFAAQRFKSDL